MLRGHPYRFVSSRRHFFSCLNRVFLDLKPENVLICIDDVESIISAELAASASASTPPTRLVGVPPSKGRGGNQTPRSESVFITGSQPLPSPSSSFGSSPMLDKWAFGMSKIEGEASGKPSSADKGLTMKTQRTTVSTTPSTSADLAAEVGLVSLDSKATHIGRGGSGPVQLQPGPSLLSQLAPPTRPMSVPSGSSAEHGDEAGVSSSVMSIDRQSDDSSSYMEGSTEKITVKIADLGNGVS